jgi:hypothetical protein
MDRSDRHYLKRSLAVSAGLHLMLVPLLIATMPALLGADLSATAAAFSDREAVTTVSYLSIEHRARPKARPVPAPVRAVPLPAPPRLTTVAAAAPRHIAVPRLSVGRRAHVPKGPVRSVAALFEAAAPARRNVQTANSAEPQAVAAPVPALAATPAPAPSTSPVAAAALADASSPRFIDVPQGGWGQNFERPIVADDAALADLRSRYHDVARVSVEVDDSGHATHVFLPNGLADDERAELERRLMALRYVPAECNGLHCAGTLQLTLQ